METIVDRTTGNENGETVELQIGLLEVFHNRVLARSWLGTIPLNTGKREMRRDIQGGKSDLHDGTCG